MFFQKLRGIVPEQDNPPSENEEFRIGFKNAIKSTYTPFNKGVKVLQFLVIFTALKEF